jgi:multidrug resistance efflux pump
MPVAHLYAMALGDHRISSEKKTFVPLGATDTWRWAVCVAVAVVAASTTLVRQRIAGDDSPDEPEFSDSYPGITRPRDVSTLALPTPLVVKNVLVEVGDHVRSGQPLLVLDDHDARRVVGDLRFEIERSASRVAQLAQTVALLDRSIDAWLLPAAEASKRLALAQRTAESVPNRQAKDSPERAQAALDQAIARERRVRALAEDGIVARQELEDAEIAVRVATDDLVVARRAADASAALAFAQRLQAEAQTNLTIAEQQRQRQDRFGELTQARMHQVEAENALGVAIQRLGDLTVRATGDALVAEILVKPGDRLLAGAPLVKLATVNPMIVDVDVPPAIVNALVRGEAAVVRVGGSSTEYLARIRTIAPLPGDAGGHALEVEFENPTSALLAHRTARVRLSAHR